MSFSSYGERLALLIDGNSDGAVRAIKKVGDTSEREFTRAQTSQQKWSRGLLTGGAAAIGFAAVVGKGLGSTVKAFEGQEAATSRLDATMAKMPQLAGANRKALDQLAQSTVDKTRVDDEAVTVTESMLGTFHLTEAQILKLTPLVVDYSVKTGKDMVTATKAVEGALIGKTRQLAADGIEIDKGVRGTAAYNEVVQGLARTVGGFAERDGKTFSGRLAIMQNQFENFKEGVGAGVVDELHSFEGALGGVATGMGHLSAQSEATIGRVATIGTGAIGAAGGVAILAGAAIKAKEALTVAEGEAGVFGTSLTGTGAAAIGVGVAVAGLATVYEVLTARSRGVKTVTDQIVTSMQTEKKTAEEAAKGGLADWLSKHRDEANVLHAAGISVKEYYDAILGNSHALTDVNKKLDDYQTKAYGADQVTAKGRGAYQQLGAGAAVAADRVGKLKNQLGIQSESLRNARAQTDTLKKADVELADKTQDATAAIKGEERAFQSLIDRTLDSRDAQRNEQRAVIAVAQSNADLTDKVKALTAARKAHAEGSPEVQQAERDVQLAMLDASQSSDDAKRSIEELASKEVGAKNAADAVATKHDEYVAALRRIRDTLKPGSPLRASLDQWIARLEQVPTSITTTFHTAGGAAGTTSAGSLKHFASGGTLGPGEVGVVGDTGGQEELIEGPVTVHNPRETAHIRAALAGPTGGAQIIVIEALHFHAAPGMGVDGRRQLRELGDAAMRELKSGGGAFSKVIKAIAAA